MKKFRRGTCNNKMIYVFTFNISVLVFFLNYCLFCFPLNVSDIWFWAGVWISGFVGFCLSQIIFTIFGKKFDEYKHLKFGLIYSLGLPIIIGIIFLIDLFCFKSLSRIAPEIEHVSMETMFPVTDTIVNDAIVDTTTAEKNANKVLGTLGTIGSRYVAKEYFVLTVKDSPDAEPKMVRVAPLGYDGFFRYCKYKYDGIPGYIISTTTETGSARYVELEKPIFYSPSACFSKYLKRHLRFTYPTMLLGEPHFELDDNGNGFWITPRYKHNVALAGKEVIGTVVTDANTGVSEWYRLGEEPDWVSCVYAGDYACDIYSWQGMYFDGLSNALFGKEGCWKTTEIETSDSLDRDYAYKFKDGQIWSVTGVKTLATDTKSTIAVLMTSQKTNKAFWCDIAGADEGSVMTTASEEYHAYEYTASFPSLINIDGELTYVCVVTDKESVVKNWVFINMKDISRIVTAKSEAEGFAKYRKLLKLGVTDTNEKPSNNEIVEQGETINNIDAVRVYTSNGVTYVEIDKDGQTEVYQVAQ